MFQVKENVFQKFCELNQKIQKIQTQVNNEEVTPERRVSLHKELESIQESIDHLLESAKEAHSFASNSFQQIEEMDRQVVSLYRIVEERFEEFEITTISEEAMALGRSLEKGSIFKIAKQISGLRHNILFLFKHRRPSLKHRKIVNLALKLSDQAEGVLSKSGKTSTKQLKLITLLKSLLKEAVINANLTFDVLEGELAMELYEIIELIQQRRSKEGRMRLNLILSKFTQSQRRRLESASDNPKELVKFLMEIAEGDPCLDWETISSEGSIIRELHA